MTTDTQDIDLEDVRVRVGRVGEELQRLHIGKQMHDIIIMGILCLLSRSNMLLFGLFGNNKSRVITGLLSRVQELKIFVLGGSAFSTKPDMVGPLDLKALEEGRYIYRTENMMPTADAAFLDEVGEMGKPLHKELHSMMNERRFSNGGVWQECPLFTVFGATNRDPEDIQEGSAAFLDRWHFKVRVDYPQTKDEITTIRKLNRRIRLQGLEGKEEVSYVTRSELRAAQREVLRVRVPKEIDDAIYKIQKKLNVDGGGIMQSPRRLASLDPIIQASAWLRGNSAVDMADLAILKYAFWHRYEDIPVVDEVMKVEAKSHISQSNELLRDIEKIFNSFSALSKGDPNRSKYKKQADEKALKLSKMRDEYAQQGKNPAVIEKAYDEAQKILHKMIRSM